MIARGIRGPNLSRTFKVLRAVLNLAARHDNRILNRDQWRDGLRLAGINTFKTRNQILDDDQVRRIVAESYRLDPAFGLYVETHAVTGARSSQISRLNICDLQDARPDPRLMMPPSRKGAKREEARGKACTDTARPRREATYGRRHPPFNGSAPTVDRADGER
jgi:hypothetical protein